MLKTLRDAARLVWSWKWYYLAALVVILPALLWMTRYDTSLIRHFQLDDNPAANDIAGEVSTIGKTNGTTLWLCLALFAAAYFFKKARPAKIAVCILLALMVSGIGVNILRPAFGRARPYSVEAGTFHGPSFGHEYNGFPSGHSSEAWTVATVVSFAYPPAALPASAYAGTMMWARMQRNQHFPVDVLAGAFWGIACALPFAIVARRKDD